MLIDIFDLNQKNQKSHDFFKKVMIFASPGNIDPKWKQNCVTDTSFTLIIDNHKQICVHDCQPIAQKSLRSCTQLVISCNN